MCYVHINLLSGPTQNAGQEQDKAFGILRDGQLRELSYLFQTRVRRPVTGGDLGECFVMSEKSIFCADNN